MMEEKLIAILASINKDLKDYTGSNMLADGLVDSFGIIEIVERISETFDVEIDADLITVENLANKDAMIKLIERLKAK